MNGEEEKKEEQGINQEQEILPQTQTQPQTANMTGDLNTKEPKEHTQSVFGEPTSSGVRYYSMEGAKQSSPKNKLKKNLLILGGIFLIVIAIGVLFNNIDESSMRSDYTGNVYPSDQYIAKISVEGTILSGGSTDYFGTPVGYQHQWTLDTIDELIEDENNSGMIIFVNSPGGGVYESDELYIKIKEYQERTGRPVYSAMGVMAASGGYYISAPCDKIIANRNCWTGSIGVTMGTMFDFSEFLGRYGIKTNTITSGANKSMGSATEPMTEEQKQIMQGLVNEAYEQFVNLVAEGRGLDIQKVKTIADGRIYTAKQALSLGLIDQIGTFDEAVLDMQVNYGLEECEVVDIYDNEESVFSTLFGKLNIPTFMPQSDATAVLKLVEESGVYPVSYMCEVLK